MHRVVCNLSRRHFSNRSLSSLIEVKSEVQEALSANGPVVALESTIITHGMPYPQNLETALEVESIVRQQVNDNIYCSISTVSITLTISVWFRMPFRQR